jgi:hypothetical protein
LKIVHFENPFPENVATQNEHAYRRGRMIEERSPLWSLFHHSLFLLPVPQSMMDASRERVYALFRIKFFNVSLNQLQQ